MTPTQMIVYRRSPVIKGLRFNKITSKGFMTNLKSLGHVFYREKNFTKKFLGESA